MGLPHQTPRTELIRKFRALGWDGPVSGGRHSFMRRGPRKIHIPNEHQKDIGIRLLKEILRQASISVDEWDHA